MVQERIPVEKVRGIVEERVSFRKVLEKI